MRALVLSGGGSKGAFQVGVLSGIGSGFKIVTGSSVGALNAAYLSMFPVHRFRDAVKGLEELWCTEILGLEMLWKKRWPWGLPGLWRNSIGKQKGLRKLVYKKLDRETILRSGVMIAVPAVDLITGAVRYFDRWDKALVDGVIASASIPVLMEPVRVGEGRYVDAGVREMAPLKRAIRMGATEIVVVSCQPIVSVNEVRPKDVRKSLSVGMRSMELAVNEVLVNDLERCEVINQELDECTESKKKKVKLTVIAPEKELGDSLDFDPGTIRRYMKHGVECAATQL